MAELRLQHLKKRFGDTEVIKGIDLTIQSGKFVVCVGPSGCGKSSLLRLVAGLEEPTVGRIFIDGRDVTDSPPAHRGVAMVFQSYALYPHMTVAENLGFGLKMAGLPKDRIAEKVSRAAAILQIDSLMSRKPGALSGGQRQRVAIGRAIVRDPKVFLFDEPLSNLDAELRIEMRLQIAKLHQQMPETTMIYVTHDQTEAMTLADEIVVLNDGLIEQVGSPLRLYHSPDNMFVAGFIGSPRMNFIPVKIDTLGSNRLCVKLPDGRALKLPFFIDKGRYSRDAWLGVRPESFTSGGGGPDVELAVQLTENLGATTYFHGYNKDFGNLVVESNGPVNGQVKNLRASIVPEKTYLFSDKGSAFARCHVP